MKKALYAVDYVKLLHSKFLMRDRRKLETEIMNFSNDENLKKKTGIWISTQIVEASLDIDFDELHTEMCTADSLLQRMGRCFRKREYSSNEPNIYIYDTRNGVGKNSVYDVDIYNASIDALREYDNEKIFLEGKKHNYVASVYDEKINSKLLDSEYYKKIESNIDMLEKITPFSIEKSEVDLRNIQSISVIPESIYIELCQSGKMDRWKEILNGDKSVNKSSVFSEISDYCINIRDTVNNLKNRDKSEISHLKNMGIYRIRCHYEFNSDALLGEGLVQDKPIEGDNCI